MVIQVCHGATSTVRWQAPKSQVMIRMPRGTPLLPTRSADRRGRKRSDVEIKKNVIARVSQVGDDRAMQQINSYRVPRAQLPRLALALAFALLAAGAVQARHRAGVEAEVAFPDEYRTWLHVKTVLVSARHPEFARTGGFRHIYANPQAAAGYRTGNFPEGSVIVVDWLEGRDDDGMFTETVRRRLDVMVKDRSRFEATGGWGFERFGGNSRTERTVTSPTKQCFECHSGPGTRDSVFSKLRE